MPFCTAQVLDCACVRQCLAAGAFPLHLREPFQTYATQGTRTKDEQAGSQARLLLTRLRLAPVRPMCTAPGPSGPRAFYRWSLDAALTLTLCLTLTLNPNPKP